MLRYSQSGLNAVFCVCKYKEMKIKLTCDGDGWTLPQSSCSTDPTVSLLNHPVSVTDVFPPSPTLHFFFMCSFSLLSEGACASAPDSHISEKIYSFVQVKLDLSWILIQSSLMWGMLMSVWRSLAPSCSCWRQLCSPSFSLSDSSHTSTPRCLADDCLLTWLYSALTDLF